MPKDTKHEALPVASLRDGLAFIAEVVAPTLAKGPIIRRPRVVRLAERLDLDARAVRRMRRLRDAYGGDLLLVPLPGRLHAVALTPVAVARVLEGAPDPFTPASLEKRWALGHFEPDVSLISTGPARAERRRVQEEVLEPERRVHSGAGPILAAVEDEAGRLLAGAGGGLGWEGFAAAWYPTTRRIVLGDGARDDAKLHDLLARLRRRANWVVLRRRKDLLAELRARIIGHMARAEPDSLAGRMRTLSSSPKVAADQLAHHLFAFDAGTLATFRALALLAAHPEALAAARAEAADEERADLPLLRATLLEALRLWPTTPMILRQATRDVDWEGARLPRGANVIVFAPFFHRDDDLPFAHRFAPGLWTGDEAQGGARGGAALVPFSAGPARCPAAELVPMVAAAMLAGIVAARTPRLADPRRLRADRPLPGTLDPYSLRFALD